MEENTSKERQGGTLIDKIKESTSDARDELQVHPIGKDDILRFVIRKEKLSQRIKRALGKNQEVHDKEAFRVSNDLLEKGIWAEIDSEHNHVWVFLKWDREPSDESEEAKTSLSITVASDKNLNESFVLGINTKPIHSSFCVFLPNLVMMFNDNRKNGWDIVAQSAISVVTKRAEGLVGMFVVEGEDGVEQRYFVTFDAKGQEIAEEDGL